MFLSYFHEFLIFLRVDFSTEYVGCLYALAGIKLCEIRPASQ